MDRRHAAATLLRTTHDVRGTHPERHHCRERNFGHVPYVFFCSDLRQPGALAKRSRSLGRDYVAAT
jgi:hypothetical protein